jgi:hypothetical protein
MISIQVVVVAKAPVPGQVKTRLCPPCTPQQAAAVALAALADTLRAADAAPVAVRTLLLHGRMAARDGWRTVVQRGDGLGARLANGLADTAVPGVATVAIGMDTPQVTPTLLAGLADGLADADAVLAPAADGGWWALALRDPADGRILAAVPMSTATTGAATAAALAALRPGYRLRTGPVLRDVDTAADAWAIAAENPGTSFAGAVARHVRKPATV